MQGSVDLFDWLDILGCDTMIVSIANLKSYLKLPIWCIELAKKKNKLQKNEKIDAEEKILSLLSSLKKKQESQKDINLLEQNIMEKLLVWFPHINQTMPIVAPIYSLLVISQSKSIGNNVSVGPLYSKMEMVNALINTDLNKLLDPEKKLIIWNTKKAKADFTSLVSAITFILSKKFEIGLSDKKCKMSIKSKVFDAIEIDLRTWRIITDEYVEEMTNKLFEILRKCNMTLSIPFENKLKKKGALIIEKETLDPK